jgi:hypothetical protein
MIMRKIIITAATAVAAGLLATACGTSTSHGSQVGQAPINGGGSMASAPAAPAAQPAVNPVTILKLAGAKPSPGEVMGDHDVFGNRMAEGKFATNGWESVLVYTAANDAHLQEIKNSDTAQVDDYTGVIVIPAKRAVIIASAWEDNGPHWAPGGTPAQIAQRVHGQQQG